MFIRPCYRNKDGKRHAYWALVESYRTQRGPRQRVIAYLGKLDEAGRLGLKQAADDTPISSQKTFFPEPEPEWVEVDASAVRVENCRQFGGPWLALELIKTLGLDTFFQETIPSGHEDVPWSVMALVLVIARLCEPSRELSIAENFSRKTAVCDLLGVPQQKLYDNRLYRAGPGNVVRGKISNSRNEKSSAAVATAVRKRRRCTRGSRSASNSG